MSRVIVYSRQGIPFGEINSPNVVRSWVLNEPGVAAFILPNTDEMFDKDAMAFGNLVLVKHPRAGDWVGVLWPSPQPWQWSTSGASVRAIGAENILRRRVSGAKLAGVTLGGGIEEALGDLNKVEDTLIRPGTIWKGGKPRTVDFRFRWLADVLSAAAKEGKLDWGIEPVIDDSVGLLTLALSVYERRGTAWDFALEEGKNVEWVPDTPMMVEQGDVYNEVTVFLKAVHNDVRDFKTATDAVSRNTYGLSQMAVNGQPDLQASADAQLATKKQHRRTFRVNAIDVDNTFDYLGLGDTLWLHLPSIHWEGIHTRVRILAKEFSDATGKMLLTLDEVAI